MSSKPFNETPEEQVRRRKRDAEAQIRYRQRRKERGIVETAEQRANRQRLQREYIARKLVVDSEGFRQRANAAAKRSRDRHPEETKAATKKWRENNLDRWNEMRRDWWRRNQLWLAYKGARQRAKKAGIEFTITFGDIPPIGERCPIFNRPFERPESGRGPYTPSLDRIDPTKGYIPGNVWFISDRANRVKNNGTAEEHEMIAQAMRRMIRDA